jgi:hypothetical protein
MILKVNTETENWNAIHAVLILYSAQGLYGPIDSIYCVVAGINGRWGFGYFDFLVLF